MSALRTLLAILGMTGDNDYDEDDYDEDDYDVRSPSTGERLTHQNGKWVDSNGRAERSPDVRRFNGMDRVDDRMKPPGKKGK